MRHHRTLKSFSRTRFDGLNIFHPAYNVRYGPVLKLALRERGRGSCLMQNILLLTHIVQVHANAMQE